MLVCIVYAKDVWSVATVEIPGAFRQVHMDELFYIKFEGVIADMLIMIDP